MAGMVNFNYHHVIIIKRLCDRCRRVKIISEFEKSRVIMDGVRRVRFQAHLSDGNQMNIRTCTATTLEAPIVKTWTGYFYGEAMTDI